MRNDTFMVTKMSFFYYYNHLHCDIFPWECLLFFRSDIILKDDAHLTFTMF